MARRSIFVSFHQADADEVSAFVKEMSPSFSEIRTLGVTDEDGLAEKVESGDAGYVMRRIREKYISGTSCTVVAIGQCTWARRYVDWEVAATLRNNQADPRGGLLAIQLQSAAANQWTRLPDRVKLNISWDGNSDQSGYARFMVPPANGVTLASWVEAAIKRRDTLEPTTGSTSGLRQRSSICP